MNMKTGTMGALSIPRWFEKDLTRLLELHNLDDKTGYRSGNLARFLVDHIGLLIEDDLLVCEYQELCEMAFIKLLERHHAKAQKA